MTRHHKSWLEEITEAFHALGGVASLQELYEYIERNTERKLTPQWKATVRREIENHSSDSDNYTFGEDRFRSVKGIGRGVWGLRGFQSSVQKACDLEEPAPPKHSQEISRIIRNTKLSNEIKQLHNYQCQICDTILDLGNHIRYAETHHLKPLGSPHDGPDIKENILCVCPNCHALLDFGAIKLSLKDIRPHPKHRIGQQFIQYHNEKIARKP